MPEPAVTQAAFSETASTGTAPTALGSADRSTPDLPQPQVEMSDETVAEAISETILTTPGVVRLEPTLSTTGPKMLRRHSHTDGIRLLTRAHTVEIDINIATNTTQPARTIARDIHTRVDTRIATLGRTRGRITVNVLTIEDASN